MTLNNLLEVDVEIWYDLVDIRYDLSVIIMIDISDSHCSILNMNMNKLRANLSNLISNCYSQVGARTMILEQS